MDSTPTPRPVPTPAHAAAGDPGHVDVLIVGAGLSGIGAARRLQSRCPDKRYAILEARDAIGGTWDLFRYPGVRSDSDMHTLGYDAKPWTHAKAIADGPSILAYIREAAAEAGIGRHIRFGHRVRRAAWSSERALWSVEAERGDGSRAHFTCGFLFACSGYYDHDEGHRPAFDGEADFRGTIVHPQFWPADLDHAGKRVVVIGSGATAVTLVPAMAKSAAHVVMLQRSPTYVVSRPSVDALAQRLRRWLPEGAAYRLTRWKNVLLTMYFYRLARRRPARAKAWIVAMARRALGAGHDVATHFTPRYDPWDQRLCLVPDADLFRALRSGSASIETDTIERFTAHGIRLASGRELAADIVVTATGLKLNALGGAAVEVDGRRIDVSQTMVWRGMMFGGIPNFASTFGYTNASWTLKADLTSAWVCRLLRHMDRRGAAVVVPQPDPAVQARPLLDFTSGYVQRAAGVLPKQGASGPWRVAQNYLADLASLRFSRIDHATLRFSPPPEGQVAQ